ncbi:MAG: hypothetical protein ACKOB3_04365 [Holophagaceae bacterium]
MTGETPLHQGGLNLVTPPPPPPPPTAPNEFIHTKYFRAIHNKHGKDIDMENMCKFVRDFIFYAFIHDARGAGTNPEDEIMKENGDACNIFVSVFSKDVNKISNVKLFDSTIEEREHYLRYLWKEGLQSKEKHNTRRALSNERSAVYAAIAESFKSK